MTNEQLLAEELRNALSLLWQLRPDQHTTDVFEKQMIVAIDRRFTEGADLLKKLGHSQP